MDQAERECTFAHPAIPLLECCPEAAFDLWFCDGSQRDYCIHHISKRAGCEGLADEDISLLRWSGAHQHPFDIRSSKSSFSPFPLSPSQKLADYPCAQPTIGVIGCGVILAFAVNKGAIRMNAITANIFVSDLIALFANFKFQCNVKTSPSFLRWLRRSEFYIAPPESHQH